MKRRQVGLVVSVVLVVGLGLCALTGAQAVNAARATKPVQIHRLLYQANWRHGKLGWSSSGDGSWQVVNGQLLYDGNGSSAILAPVQTKNRWNYAIEARLQSTAHTDYNGNSGFGIVVRGSGPIELYPEGSPGNGLAVGPQQRAGYTDNHPNGSFVSIWPAAVYPEPIATTDFDPGTNWHTYRIEVRGNQFKVLVDGQAALLARSNKFLGKGHVGLFSIESEISVSTFKVSAL